MTFTSGFGHSMADVLSKMFLS